MDSLDSGLRALGLMEDTPVTMAEQELQNSEASHDLSGSPSTSVSHFRLYDLPLEIRLQIFETYVSTLYPRIVYRCFCYLCEPIPSTDLKAKPSPEFQRRLHRTKHVGRPSEKDAKFRRRFSYCEDLPFASNIRTVNHGSGQDFDFPYGTGMRPAEPGIFVASKELRQNVIDAMLRTRPLYVFDQDVPTWWIQDRHPDIHYLPAWYRNALRFGEELRPRDAYILKLSGKWSSCCPNLREIRLNYGRVRINASMSWKTMEWVQGVPRDLLESMASRRVRSMMQDICFLYGPVPVDKQGYPEPWFEQQRRVQGQRSWKIVVSVEFRVKVREDKRSKRQSASIYVTAREVEKACSFNIECRLGDRLLKLEQDAKDCLCLVSRSAGEGE